MFQFLVPVWQRVALNSFVSGDYQKAEKYFHKIHRVLPNGRRFEYNMGLIRLAQSDYKEAESFLKKDLDFYGESYNSCRVLGDLYYIWGRREDAANWYKKALTDCSIKEDRNILKIRIDKCNSEKAFENVKKSHISYRDGNKLLKEEKFEKALTAFAKAVEQDCSNFQALNNMGSIFMNHFQKYGEALDCFERAGSMSSLPAIGINIKKVKDVMAKTNIDKQ